MPVVVPGDAALAARWWQEPAFAVEAQGTDRDPGRFGQFGHPVLAFVVRHAGSLRATGGNDPAAEPYRSAGSLAYPPDCASERWHSRAWLLREAAAWSSTYAWR
ncbi:hypothetical protein GCM10010315_23930 [Streptomyces luteosporeus]|uniref:Uncharacterized protein n=1 Tax=Streptomyces luteosporeus TaxID=173856 RepID=A0ABN3TR86_9ACTN